MSCAPVIVLVGPQMVENIGMTARAMLNFGLTELRLVHPRDPWPLEDWLRERLYAAASKADVVLNQTRVFPDLAGALHDCHWVLATCPRDHDLTQNPIAPRAAMQAAQQRASQGAKVAILFGPERNGLTNAEIAQAHQLVTIPTNPQFYSLNLAQAVLVMAYEWQLAQSEQPALPTDKHIPAPQAEVEIFSKRLDELLAARGFYTTAQLAPIMQTNLRVSLQRSAWSEQELRTWHGVLSALTKRNPSN